MTFSNLNLSPE